MTSTLVSNKASNATFFELVPVAEPSQMLPSLKENLPENGGQWLDGVNFFNVVGCHVHDIGTGGWRHSTLELVAIWG